MAPVPPGNLVFLQQQQAARLGPVVLRIPDPLDPARHGHYESPFRQIHIHIQTTSITTTTTRHSSCHLKQFLDHHPQLVTLLLAVCLVSLLAVLLLSACSRDWRWKRLVSALNRHRDHATTTTTTEKSLAASLSADDESAVVLKKKNHPTFHIVEVYPPPSTDDDDSEQCTSSKGG